MTSREEYEVPDDPVAQALDQAFAASRNWLDPASKLDTSLKDNGIDPASEPALPARLAVGYFLDFPVTYRGRVELASMQFYGDRPAITPRDHDQAVEDIWSKWVEATPLLALQARLHDLLAQRGGRMVPHHAFWAISAYCDLAENPHVGILVDDERRVLTWETTDLDLGLARALALRKFNPRPTNRNLIADPLERAIERVLARLRELSLSNRSPGIFSMLAAQLVFDRAHLDSSQLDDLRTVLSGAFDSAVDPDLADDIGGLLLQLKSRPPIEVGTRRVEVRMDRAAASTPMVGMSFLQQAQNLARDLGLSGLADHATRQMQALRLADFDWKVVSSEATIGRELMEAQIRRWSRGASAMEALESWALSQSPTGDFDSAHRDASERASASRLTNMINRVIYGADGLPQFTVSTLEERVLYELSVSDQLAFQINGQLLADALDAVTRFGVPNEAQILEWLTGEGEADTRTTARILVKGLHDYWLQDYDVAAARSIPQIEAALRQLVLMFNEPAYIAVRKGARGRYVGIDQLLDLLRPFDLDPDWDHAIRAFCLGPHGLNVRHDFAHGFPTRLPPRVLAALSLRVLLLLVRMGGRPDNTPQSEFPPVPMISVARSVEHGLRYTVRHPESALGLLKREVTDVRQITGRLGSRALRIGGALAAGVYESARQAASRARRSP